MSEEECRLRNSHENELVASQRPYERQERSDKNLTVKQLRQETVRRGVEPSGNIKWLERRMHCHDWVAQCAWLMFEEELRHRLAEKDYNSKPGVALFS